MSSARSHIFPNAWHARRLLRAVAWRHLTLECMRERQPPSGQIEACGFAVPRLWWASALSKRIHDVCAADQWSARPFGSYPSRAFDTLDVFSARRFALLAFPRLCGFSGQAPRPLAFDVFYPAAVQAAASATPPSF